MLLHKSYNIIVFMLFSVYDDRKGNGSKLTKKRRKKRKRLVVERWKYKGQDRAGIWMTYGNFLQANEYIGRKKCPATLFISSFFSLLIEWPMASDQTINLFFFFIRSSFLKLAFFTLNLSWGHSLAHSPNFKWKQSNARVQVKNNWNTFHIWLCVRVAVIFSIAKKRTSHFMLFM